MGKLLTRDVCKKEKGGRPSTCGPRIEGPKGPKKKFAGEAKRKKNHHMAAQEEEVRRVVQNWGSGRNEKNRSS